METKKGCPFCQDNAIHVVKSAPSAMEGLQVECSNCGARGPIYENKEAAIEGWDLGIVVLGKRMRKE